MAQHTDRNYLAGLRKQWGLTQVELGGLLGVSGDAVSKYEANKLRPKRNTLLAIEVVFGKPARAVFPALYGAVEQIVGRRAYRLDEKLRHRSDPESLKKLKLLKQITERSGSIPTLYDAGE